MTIAKQLSRRNFLQASSIAALSTTVTACAAIPTPQPVMAPEAPVTNGDEALQRLIEGNKRYVANKSISLNESENRRIEVAKAQHPFAAIFSCVDSRVPPELVFDRGLGDLFVIRTAGHVIDNAVLGSLEYGVAELKIPLLMVMGHEKCGAVKATIETLEKHGEAPDQIEALVKGIEPAVEKVKEQTGDMLSNAVHANTALTVARLMESPILGEAVAKGQLKIVGGCYELDSGIVEMLKA